MVISQDFLEFAKSKGALQFGEFVLKSGRQSPYFFNTGNFNSGSSLSELANFYADTLIASEIEFDFIFGPAYKGIPLAAATACALWQRHQRDVPFASDRKEAKTHGEGGSILGAGELLKHGSRRIVIIDDVITAGTAIREAVNFIKAAGPDTNEIVAVLIALDRQERSSEDSKQSAVQAVEAELSLKVISIADLDALLDYSGADERIRAYRDHFRCE